MVYKGILGFTRVYWGLQGYTRVHKGIQWYTTGIPRVFNGIQGYTTGIPNSRLEKSIELMIYVSVRMIYVSVSSGT